MHTIYSDGDKTVEEISSRGEFEIVAIERNDNTMMPLKDTKIKDNDTIYFSVLDESLAKFKQTLY